MSGFDGERVFYTDQQLGGQTTPAGDQKRYEVQLRQFLRSHVGYLDQLKSNVAQGTALVEINLGDVFQFDARLAHELIERPDAMIPLFEQAASEALQYTSSNDLKKDIQVVLVGLDRHTDMRRVDSADVSKLVSLPAIVIAASAVRPKSHRLTLTCRNCGSTQNMITEPGFKGISLPRYCSESGKNPEAPKCPIDPYQVDTDHSTYVDWQSLKLQERPEMVPHGDMPRHLLACADRGLVERVKPGSRVQAIGVYSTFQQVAKSDSGSSSKGSVQMPYLRIIGLEITSEEEMRFTAEDEEEMLELSRSKGANNETIYDLLWKSVAPAIFGHDDIKKAIACLMVGGSRKQLPDGMRLRGDINVLLLGDPSVAKSQFLKFVHRVAPIAVYTSGKGSSAAGLTASVVRDPSSGEFHLEGGALVLGDGGIVCIDEFDKMRVEDRVAIHEAMEQQTISIAKAGITTILNARSSVLAAANPVYGRYDVMRSPGENISLQTTILSRFDMIFILLDKTDRERDEMLTKHVLGLHQNAQSDNHAADGPIPVDKLKKYIGFCRQRDSPRLSEEAAEHLKSNYIEIRDHMNSVSGTSSNTPIPITVRQLEAVVRISEALARIELADVVGTHHVTEAIRLFKSSTMNAIESGINVEGGYAESPEAIQQAEAFIKSRVGITMRVSRENLRRQFMVQQRLKNPNASSIDLTPVDSALNVLQARGDVRLMNQGQHIQRLK